MAAGLLTRLTFRLPQGMLYKMSGKPPITLGDRTLNAACQTVCTRAGEEPLGMTGADPEEVRRLMKLGPDTNAAPPRPVQRTEHQVAADDGKAQIPLREYRPAGWTDGDSNMLYIHGGGWVLCDLDTHDGLCANIAARANCRVFSVGYRLAPEHPYPTPLQDCLAAWRWLGDAMGCKAENTAVGGDSAGGNLSAALCLSLQADGEALPCLQLLIYPAVDSAMNSKSCKEAGKGFFLTTNAMKWFWDCYAKDAKKTDPLLSPIKAKSLQGMPQAVIATAGFDPLRDQGQAYLKKLQKDSVDCWHREYPDLIHGFAGMTVIPAAEKAIAECLAEVHRRLHTA